MRIMGLLAALVVVFGLMMVYLRATTRVVEEVVNTEDSTQTRVEKVREDVARINRAQEARDEAVREIVGE